MAAWRGSGICAPSRMPRVLPLLLLLVLAAPVAHAEEEGPEPPDVEFFTNRDCRHCAAAAAWLARLQEERPEVVVATRHVLDDEAARRRFAALVERSGIQAATTPAFLVRERFIVGWRSAETTGRLIEDVLDGLEPSGGSGSGDGCVVHLDGSQDDGDAACVDPRDRTLDLPIVGPVRPRDLGLPLFTVVLGLVDGFNPCAMWVLLFLLSLLVHLRSRGRMFAIAGTFVLVSGIVYFAFMAAWFTFFDVIGKARAIQVVLGCVAVFVGLVHVKDVFAFHKGLSFSIPDAAKPGIYARVNRILKAENMAGAIVAVIVLAFMVNVVELLCTAGLPAIYTNVLAQHELPRLQYYGYIALYQVFYMLDDMLMLAIAIFTLSRARLQETGGRWLKALSGAVMIALGLALVFKPELLSW